MCRPIKLWQGVSAAAIAVSRAADHSPKTPIPVQGFEIKVLSEEKAIELLQTLVARDRPDLRGFENLGGLETAQQICQWLGYLPLGIELVGRYLARKPGTSLETLWQRLQDKKLAANALLQATPV